MARPSSRTAGKITAECPHCRRVQLESAFAKSTICRHCARHFDLEPKRDEAAAEAGAQSSIFARFNKLLSREHVRSIRCYQCRAGQQVSSSAKSSICPQCGGYIDLRDFKISSSFSRSLQTQGSIHITARGEATSTKIICGAADIEGKLRGHLLCTGPTRVKMKGKLYGGIDTQHLLVEKGSDVEFVRPIKAATAEIRGKISARIVCEGVIAISSSGELEGIVYAKSITVDKGGIFHGELYIGRRELEQPELLAPPAPAQADPLEGHGTFAFG